jgi:putative acetyltransferase
MSGVAVRRYRDDDAADVGRIYRRAVLEGTVARYDDRQRAAWAGYARDADEWQRRLADLDTWVAVAGGQPVGFMSLRCDGNLDLAFIQPEWMGRGVGLALYEPLEEFARQQGHIRLDAEASYLARPFFLKRGWRVLAEQEVDCRGVPMTNFLMEKHLT